MAKSKKVEEVIEGTRPRGFSSPESKDKVEKARVMVSNRYPAMSMSPQTKLTDFNDVERYLMEVGAGRVLALYNFDKKEEKEAKAPVKKATVKKAKK
jgi:hypothetical protein